MNIFLNTKFEYPEEDRLTNALMCLLEHSDRSVLSGFLKLATGTLVGVTADEKVDFDVQVSFSQSRPDARIRTSGFQMLIETKRYDALDEQQMRNHWQDLVEARVPTVLLALTGGRPGNEIVDRLNDSGLSPNPRAHHLTWSQVLEWLVGLEREFEPDTLTGFLIRQMGEYLAALGYNYFKGINMDDVLEYAEALAVTAKYQATTGKQILALLNILGERIDAALLPNRIPRKINSFGPPRVGDTLAGTTVSFEFIDFLPAQGGNDLRLRVSPAVVLPDGLSFSYYLTTYNGSGNDPIALWLDDRRDEIEKELGPLDHIKFINRKKTIYHIARRVQLGQDSPLLRGDEAGLDKLASEIADYFSSVLKWVDRANAELAGKTSGSSS